MKETSTSLRYFFILIGILCLFSISDINLIKTDLISGTLSIASVILGLIFLYIGIKFNNLIATAPKNIIKFLYISTGYFIVGLAVLLFSAYRIQGFGLSGLSIAVISAVIQILILIYLIRNIKRILRNINLNS